jgi:hypothetical protein
MRSGVARRRTLYDIFQSYDQGLSEKKSFGSEEAGPLAINEDVCKRSPACAQMLYLAVGNVWKGGKNGIPIRGRAPYRSSFVVQCLGYLLNETQDVTCDQLASRFEPCTEPL